LLGVPGRKNGRQPVAAVSSESNFEHGTRYDSAILSIRTSANRWRWPVSLRTRFFGL
jgi:hypothetical protein